jgi:PIN domain nuclease of toxin-antitoxin system
LTGKQLKNFYLTVWISVISCWELAKLVERRRLGFTIPTLTWIRRALSEYDLRLVDLTPEIAGESAGLQGFHGDRADQIIVATSRVLGMPVVTADQRLIQFQGVEAIWWEGKRRPNDRVNSLKVIDKKSENKENS